MEICKLGGGLRVTEMKQGVKNPDRVNVFVDGKYAFSLDVAQVVEFGVKVGLELSEERLAELKRASEFGKLYQRTLEWVLVRPRSVRETRDYLARKLRKLSPGAPAPARSSSIMRASRSECCGRDSTRPLPVSRGWSPEDIPEFSDEIISRLLAKRYLDDKKFAEFYVENRFVKKGISRKRLQLELFKKGIAKDIVDEVLGGRDDAAEIEKMIAKKRTKYDDEKLMQYLCRQGFPYDLVREKIAAVSED